jgi:hypothetical protein
MGCTFSTTTRSRSSEPQDTEQQRRSRTTPIAHEILPLTPKAALSQEERAAKEQEARLKEVRTRESIPLELMRAEKRGSVQQKYVNAKALAKLEGRA